MRLSNCNKGSRENSTHWIDCQNGQIRLVLIILITHLWKIKVDEKDDIGITCNKGWSWLELATRRWGSKKERHKSCSPDNVNYNIILYGDGCYYVYNDDDGDGKDDCRPLKKHSYK